MGADRDRWGQTGTCESRQRQMEETGTGGHTWTGGADRDRREAEGRKLLHKVPFFTHDFVLATVIPPTPSLPPDLHTYAHIHTHIRRHTHTARAVAPKLNARPDY